MDVDASQYASISLEMLQGGEYLQVKHLGQDYLDKPPLLFWTSTLAFKLFGAHNWSYKLFSLLFSLLGVYSTYRFAKLYYTQQIALWSALMLATCQALFLINNDVRTDTMLVGAVMFAVWQLAEYLQTGRWPYLLGSSLGLALAMLAKGPIGLMVPVLAFGSDWVFKRQWRNFLKWQWLIVIGLVGLLLAPMLYGLHQQHGSFGPYFYFWAQSFGRLTGDNPFINSGMGKQPWSPLFFVHTFLWSFLPWSLLAVGGLWLGLKGFFKSAFRVPEDQEVITLWGFILPFIALSFSDYKLPHYIYVLFPFAAILAARFAAKVYYSVTIVWLHRLLAMLLLLFAFALGIWAFPVQQVWVWAVFGAMGIAALYYVGQKAHWVTACLFAIIAANWMLNASTYPEILQYQSTSVVGRDLAAHNPPQAIALLARGHALDFYAQRILPYHESVPGELLIGTYIYANQQGLDTLQQSSYLTEIMYTYPHYKVTALTWPFINPATRASKLQDRYLVRVQGEK
jgi:4-amino-4-deoxy-L-arabinose transferase-like glycosyltransferase